VEDAERKSVITKWSNGTSPGEERDRAGRLMTWDTRLQSFGINGLELVSRIFASWNQLDGWLRAMDSLRRVA